eukprot:COSAG05_NODE_87_length_20404_cov_42.272051_22_plen_45_part_00
MESINSLFLQVDKILAPELDAEVPLPLPLSLPLSICSPIAPAQL